MPALLSEHDALHLLRTHCSVLRRRLVFDTSRTDGAVMKQEWMSLLCVMVTDGELASGLGYELRVAIDIVNALCSCWGFSPDRSHRFWRTAVSELWIEYSEDKYDPRRSRYKEFLFQPPPHVMLPFDRAAFSCFAIDFQEYPVSGFENTLTELWRQVTWTDAASKCPDWILHRRRVMMEQLVGNGLVVRPIRVLHLELIVPTNATALPWHSVDPPELLEPEWSVLIKAISEIGRGTCARPAKGPLQQLLRGSATSTSVPTSKHELSIAFHSDYKHGVYLHSSTLEAMQQLLCGCRSVRCITLNLQLVREADTTNQVGLFGVLLRSLLVELKTLKTLRLFTGVTKRAVAPTLAAVGSVLPLAWSLESLSLSCFYAGDDDQANQWCWLEYGLSHPLRRDADLPELMLTVDETGATDAVLEARLEAARRSENPLKSVVHAAIAVATTQSQTHDISCEWYVVGTAVARVIIESIAAYLNPYLRGRPVLDVAVDTKLEAVVRIAQLGVVGVIVRGCGLCWVMRHGVRIECEPFKSEQVRSTNGARLFGLTAVHVIDRAHSMSSGVPIFRWLECKQIQSLALTGFQNPLRPNIGDDLELILRYCPNVATLVLIRYGVRTLQPLVDAYASVSRPCRVTSLVVVVTYGDRYMRDTECLPLLAMLSDPTHPGARLLRHLCLVTAHHTLWPVFRVSDIARMLATNSVLETVYIRAEEDAYGRYSSYPQKAREWKESARTLLERFQDQVLNECSRVGIGLLSVVGYYGERRGTRVKEGIWKGPRRFRQCSVSGCLDETLVRHILLFVGATRVRCVRWVCCGQQHSISGLAINRGRSHFGGL